MQRITLFSLWTGIALFIPGNASLRAGSIDEPIANVLAGTALTVLEEMKYKSVAVLPFRYQKGTTATFNAGGINQNTARRLENAMVLRNGDDSGARLRTRLQIATDVPNTAKNKVRDWFTNPTERRKLFTLNYPLAWDPKTLIKPDVFLTGVIKVEANGEQCSLTLEYFTKDNLTIRPLEYCKVERIPVDRQLLSEAGESYVITKELKAKYRGVSFETLAARSAKRRDGESIPPDVQVSPDNINGLALKIYYDEQEQSITRETGREDFNEFRVVTPQPGQAVKIVVTHTGGGEQLIPFVLRVNGQSTFNQEEALELNEFRKWLIYSPSHPDNVRQTSNRYTFAGYTMEDKNEMKFSVLSDSDSKNRVSQMGDKAGLIELDVFGTGQQEFRKITTYGLQPRSLKQQPPTSFENLVDRLWKTTNAKRNYGVRHRGLIEAGAEPYPTKVSNVELGTVTPTASLTIRYYSAEPSSLDLKVTTD